MSAFPNLPDTFALHLPEVDEPAATRPGPAGKLQNIDNERPGFPLEHWLVGGAGALLLLSAGRRGSPLSRLLKRTIGAALIGRAARGREGLGKLLAGRAARQR